MPKNHDINKVPEREVLPGCFAKIFHSEAMTVVYWRLLAGTTVPRHSHPAEQITHLLDGEMDLTIGDEVHQLTSGKIVRIQSDIPHSVITSTECKIIDTFAPARSDLDGLLL